MKVQKGGRDMCSACRQAWKRHFSERISANPAQGVIRKGGSTDGS